MYHISKNQYDVVLKNKFGIKGLDRKDTLEMLDLIGSEEFYPIEIKGGETEASGMGFITKEAAEKLCYSYEDPYSDFTFFIQKLIANSDFFQPISGTQNVFDFHGLKIWIL